MGAKSKIEWTESTWSPLVGCTKVSAGCDHCYAETQVNTRFHPAALARGGKSLEAFPAPFETVSIRPDRFLTQPLRWREPRRVFVNSLSDLFHDDVPADFIAKVFAVMACNYEWDRPTHTFQILTKRHARMRSLLNSPDFRKSVAAHAGKMSENGDQVHDAVRYHHWPLPNVWLGVSVESQQWADIRIPALLDTPAAVWFVSGEPLLASLDLTPWLHSSLCPMGGGGPLCACCPGDARLNWVIVGGESGPGARPMRAEWATSLRDQCAAAGVPFLFKQAGTVLAREWGAKGKGSDPAAWLGSFPREYPQAVADA